MQAGEGAAAATAEGAGAGAGESRAEPRGDKKVGARAGARGQATWAAASPVMVPEAVARMERGGAEGMEAVGSVAAAARREGVGTVDQLQSYTKKSSHAITYFTAFSIIVGINLER